MNAQDLYKAYDLNEGDLTILFDCVVADLANKGIDICFKDMEPAIENKAYGVEQAAEAHHETCISDGVTVYLHDDLADAGGMTGRLFDLLHVGSGHAIQWNSDASAGLSFYGENAWEIGSKFFLGASEEELQIAHRYEIEATAIAKSNLLRLLKDNHFEEPFKSGYARFFNDQARTDEKYIIDYYRTGEAHPFYDGWISDAPPIIPIDVTTPLTPVKRDKLPLALLSIR